MDEEKGTDIQMGKEIMVVSFDQRVKSIRQKANSSEDIFNSFRKDGLTILAPSNQHKGIVTTVQNWIDGRRSGGLIAVGNIVASSVRDKATPQPKSVITNTFILVAKHPPVLLTVHENDDESNALEHNLSLARELTDSLLSFSSEQFSILAIVLPLRTFDNVDQFGTTLNEAVSQQSKFYISKSLQMPPWKLTHLSRAFMTLVSTTTVIDYRRRCSLNQFKQLSSEKVIHSRSSMTPASTTTAIDDTSGCLNINRFRKLSSNHDSEEVFYSRSSMTSASTTTAINDTLWFLTLNQFRKLRSIIDSKEDNISGGTVLLMEAARRSERLGPTILVVLGDRRIHTFRAKNICTHVCTRTEMKEKIGFESTVHISIVTHFTREQLPEMSVSGRVWCITDDNFTDTDLLELKDRAYEEIREITKLSLQTQGFEHVHDLLHENKKKLALMGKYEDGFKVKTAAYKLLGELQFKGHEVYIVHDPKEYGTIRNHDKMGIVMIADVFGYTDKQLNWDSVLKEAFADVECHMIFLINKAVKKLSCEFISDEIHFERLVKEACIPEISPMNLTGKEHSRAFHLLCAQKKVSPESVMLLLENSARATQIGPVLSLSTTCALMLQSRLSQV